MAAGGGSDGAGQIVEQVEVDPPVVLPEAPQAAGSPRHRLRRCVLRRLGSADPRPRAQGVFSPTRHRILAHVGDDDSLSSEHKSLRSIVLKFVTSMAICANVTCCLS